MPMAAAVGFLMYPFPWPNYLATVYARKSACRLPAVPSNQWLQPTVRVVHQHRPSALLQCSPGREWGGRKGRKRKEENPLVFASKAADRLSRACWQGTARSPVHSTPCRQPAGMCCIVPYRFGLQLLSVRCGGSL